jgi:hypothetical protein
MIINSGDLNLAQPDRLLVISCPAVGVELRCDLNETRDRIVGSSIVGDDNREAHRIAGLMVAAGNAHLEKMKVVHGLTQSRECDHLELVNDTRVFEAFDYNMNWRGTATKEAIKLAGFRADPASWGYYPKELLVDGWAFVAPRRR